MFKGTKLEVESILREVCERVLADPTIPREKAQLRAVALQMLGEAYMGVRKDEGAGVVGGSGSGGGGAGAGHGGGGGYEDADYVKVDTKSSRAREARGR